MRFPLACLLLGALLAAPANAEEFSLDCDISGASGDNPHTAHIDVTDDAIYLSEQGATASYKNKEEKTAVYSKEYIEVTPSYVKFGNMLMFNEKGGLCQEVYIDRTNGAYIGKFGPTLLDMKVNWKGMCRKGTKTKTLF